MSSSSPTKPHWYDRIKSVFKGNQPKKTQAQKKDVDSAPVVVTPSKSTSKDASSTVNVSTQTGPSRQATTITLSTPPTVESAEPVIQSPATPKVMTPHETDLQVSLSFSQSTMSDSSVAPPNPSAVQPQTRDAATGVEITAEDITDGDIVIAVMGATGVGKTTFINSMNLGCNPDELAHHELDAGTRGVTCIKIPFTADKNDGNLVLVDTPGFDDPTRTNAEVLHIIANWLEKTYRKGRLLNGLIYLQRITDIRLDAGASSTLAVFQRLYGGSGYDKVALVTSMWNDVPPNRIQQYEAKEQELQDNAWRALLWRKNPPLVARFHYEDHLSAQQSASLIIADLLKKSLSTTIKTRLQQELVDDKTALPRTDAGRAVFTLTETVKYYFKKPESET